MKITSVDIIRSFKEPSIPAEVAVGNVPWHPVFVRVNTDEGISGLGEVGVAYGNAQSAGFGMAVDFAKCIIGLDPMNNEQIWDRLHRLTFWGMGNGGVIMAGISGIDIALWDIRGKALDAPVWKLLGGKTNTRLRAYASQLQFDWGKVSHSLAKPEEYAEAMRKAMADGFDAVKVDPVGFDKNGVWMGRSSRGILQRDQMKLAVDRVAAMREAGPDVDIIIELHALTDATTSVQLGRELQKLGCFYYEEPTQPLNAPLFREIHEKVDIPIATGERVYTRWGYRPFFEDHSIPLTSSSPTCATWVASRRAKRFATRHMSTTLECRSTAAAVPFPRAPRCNLRPSFRTSSSTSSTPLPSSRTTSGSARTTTWRRGATSRCRTFRESARS